MTDELVAKTSSDSLWEIWFRGGCDDANLELQRVLHLSDKRQILTGLNEIINTYPDFAEPINQRAILHFEQGEYSQSIADCQRVLQLNPYHFGAQAGLGQCYVKLRKFASALRAFKLALEINPTMSHLADTIHALENAVGDG